MIDADHPCLPGHFAGNPLVPGVLILQEAVDFLEREVDSSIVSKVVQVKFVSTLLAGQPCCIEFGLARDQSVKFECWTGDRLVAAGLLSVEYRS